MPELPEVERVRLSLLPELVGKCTGRLSCQREELIILRDPALKSPRCIEGRRIVDLERRGKYLLLKLRAERGGQGREKAKARRAAEPDGLVLAMHLRMSGKLLYFSEAERRRARAAHTHMVLGLRERAGRGAAGAGELRWQDARRFGRWELFSEEAFENYRSGPKALGPEPFAPQCCAEYLMAQAARHRRLSLAAFLLDQRILAGLGNIYVQELLFAQGLRPDRAAAELGARQWEALVAAMRALLDAAIAAGGTSLRDYVDGAGRRGAYALELRVYGRRGRACTRCGGALEGARLAGRGMVYCPRCQK